ncbi:MAG: hypothetical protein QM765_31370 [Myxococcales bacterium]
MRWAKGSFWLSTGGRLYRWDGTGWQTPLETAAGLGEIWGTAPGNFWATGNSKLAKWNGSTWVLTSFPEPFTKLYISRGPSDESLAMLDGWVYRWDGTAWVKTTLKSMNSLARAWDGFSSGKQHWICPEPWTMSFWDGTAWTSTALPAGCGTIWGTEDGVIRTVSVEGILRRQYPVGP